MVKHLIRMQTNFVLGYLQRYTSYSSGIFLKCFIEFMILIQIICLHVVNFDYFPILSQKNQVVNYSHLKKYPRRTSKTKTNLKEMKFMFLYKKNFD